MPSVLCAENFRGFNFDFNFFLISSTIVRPCTAQKPAHHVPLFILLLRMGQDAVKETYEHHNFVPT